jgi:hypothetical protein
MSFSENRYDSQGAGGPIYGERLLKFLFTG